MTPSPEERERFAIRLLDTAAEWRRKGDARGELTTLSTVVKNLLCVAVERFTDALTGTQFLQGNDVGQLLGRMAELNQGLYAVFRRDSVTVHGSGKSPVSIEQRIAAAGTGIRPVVEQWSVSSGAKSGCVCRE